MKDNANPNYFWVDAKGINSLIHETARLRTSDQAELQQIECYDRVVKLPAFNIAELTLVDSV